MMQTGILATFCATSQREILMHFVQAREMARENTEQLVEAERLFQRGLSAMVSLGNYLLRKTHYDDEIRRSSPHTSTVTKNIPLPMAIFSLKPSAEPVPSLWRGYGGPTR
jgi:hypothetical protein